MMAERKYKPVRILRIKKTDDLKTIYVKARRSFTAADLAQYANDEPMYPAQELLSELTAIHREEERKRGKKGPSNPRRA